MKRLRLGGAFCSICPCFFVGQRWLFRQNKIVSQKAAYFLYEGVCMEKGLEPFIIQLAGQAYPMLLQQCYRPMEKETLLKTMQLLDRLKEHVPCHELFCNISEEAVKVAYDGMKR